jgi:hypothetical protein
VRPGGTADRHALCRQLALQLVQIISQRSDIQFLKVDFDANKQMCRTLGVKVLPMFHMYRGASGRVAEFSASLSKIQRLRDALDEHGAARCSLEPSTPPLLVRKAPKRCAAPDQFCVQHSRTHSAAPRAAGGVAAMSRHLFLRQQRLHLRAALRAKALHERVRQQFVHIAWLVRSSLRQLHAHLRRAALAECNNRVDARQVGDARAQPGRQQHQSPALRVRLRRQPASAAQPHRTASK